MNLENIVDFVALVILLITALALFNPSVGSITFEFDLDKRKFIFGISKVTPSLPQNKAEEVTKH